jgi:putative tricarboxylic transport membrane protein
MVQAASEGFAALFSGPTPLYILLGTLMGLFFGVLPGLGGAVALALIIPVTLAMEPNQGLAVMGAALGAVTFGGAIPAILLNTPGTPNNAASCIDGYPLSKQGRAGEAIGAAASASCIGALVGLIAFMLILPIIRDVVLLFGPPEVFMVALFGLAIIATLSKKSMVAGLIAGAFGLMFSYIGTSPVALGPRFDFGMVYLWDGIELVAALIGLFAIAEMIHLALSGKPVAGDVDLDTSGAMAGVRATLARPFLVAKSALIGIGIGTVPGVGGTVASFIALSAAKQRPGRERDQDPLIRGLVASEAANDAKDGGSLMPTLALGIPGSPSTAILLAGLILHGTFPGRQLLTEDLSIVFSLVGAMVLSNILVSGIGILASKQLAGLTRLDVNVLVPVLLVITMVGSFAVRGLMGDAYLAILFGLIGYAMRRFGYDRVPAVIGLVLGALVERSFHTSMQITDGSWAVFVTRPVTLAFFVLTLMALMLPFVRSRRAAGSPSGQPRVGLLDAVERAEEPLQKTGGGSDERTSQRP